MPMAREKLYFPVCGGCGHMGHQAAAATEEMARRKAEYWGWRVEPEVACPSCRSEELAEKIAAEERRAGSETRGAPGNAGED